MENLSRLIILRFGLKNKVSYSVTFHRLLTRINYFGSPIDLILEMEKEGLVTHEGYMDATSGILRNIKTTEKGRQEYLNNVETIIIPENIDEQTRAFLKKILT